MGWGWQLGICVPFILVVHLHGYPSYFEEDYDLSSLNTTALREVFRAQENPYLEELSGHWSFNDTNDISKYEEFDHNRYAGWPKLSIEEILNKMRGGSHNRHHNQHRVRPVPTRPPPPPQPPPHHYHLEHPIMDHRLPNTTVAQLGGNAFLNCRVRNLNTRAVSWVRRKDWHILTSGMLTYTNDERFQVLHAEGSDEWTLQIRYVQMKDRGNYECQVSTGKGRLSRIVHLDVVIPEARILGNGEYHIGQGSTISLVCVIENSPEPPEYVLWYHNGELVNHLGWDIRVKVITEQSDKASSRLLIRDATPNHAGNYSCRATNTVPDSVNVFVSQDGDNMAAIQRHNISTRSKGSKISVELYFVVGWSILYFLIKLTSL